MRGGGGKDGLCKCGHLVGNQFSAPPFIHGPGLSHLYAATCGNTFPPPPLLGREKKRKSRTTVTFEDVEFQWRCLKRKEFSDCNNNNNNNNDLCVVDVKMDWTMDVDL